MKLSRLGIALAVVGVLIGTSTVARAITSLEVTYVFTADPESGFTAFNGSTITINNNSLSNWMLTGDLGGPLTPSNSFVDPSGTSITSYSPTTWTGIFQVDASTSPLVFNGTNNTGAGTSLFPGTLDDHTSAGTSTDPAGVWAPLVAGVPDSGTTLQLFGLALAGLAACRRSLHRIW